MLCKHMGKYAGISIFLFMGGGGGGGVLFIKQLFTPPPDKIVPH